MDGDTRPDFADPRDARAAARIMESVRLSGYRIERILGMGGFGIVVAGLREGDNTPVAIKTVHREDTTARERLVFEAQALAAIGPPHVPELYESGRLDDGRPYFVFERLTIPSLDTRLGAPMAPQAVRSMAMPILDAVEAAHDRGILHRDIKPENIFVGGDPVVAKLIDFGLAKPLPATQRALVETALGLILGTPTYMSPEQCEGRRDIDSRADLYALGVVLYEMLTSVPPFRGDASRVRMDHIGREPAPPSHHVPVAVEVDAVILRCLAKNRDDRFPTVAALRDALAPALQIPRPARLRDDRSEPRGRHGSRTLVLVGVIFFEAMSGTGEATRAVTALGGTLVAITGKRCVAVFRADADRDPLQRAIEAARALVDQGIAIRVTVDRDRARVVRGRGGTQRMVAAGFHRGDRFASARSPKGTLLTSRAAEFLVRDLTVEIPGQDDLVQYLDDGADPGKSDLHSEPLIGRNSTMRALIQGARLAIETRSPAVATVLAGPGHGKSHVCAALLTGLRRADDGFLVIRIRARRRRRALPELLCAALRLSDGAPAEVAHRALIERLGVALGEEVWPAVGLACGWLHRDSPEVANLAAAPGALRATAARAAGEALRKLASEHPVGCLLDDAHLADDATLDALEYATLSEARVPLWVCVLARPEFRDLRAQWGSRCGQAYSIVLGALPSASSARLLRRLLYPASEIPDHVMVRLLDQTHGNPLFITELARAIKRRGLIRRDGQLGSWSLKFEQLDALYDLAEIDELFAHEIDELPADLAAHASLIAVLDSEVTLIEIDGVLRELAADRSSAAPTFPLDAWLGTGQLTNQGLLGARSQGFFEFRHAQLRDWIARRVPDELRERIHRAAFQYYRGTRDVPDERRAPLVAYHAARCGLREMAAMLYLELADDARDRHDDRRAVEFYTHAIELLPRAETLDRACAFRGRARSWVRLRRIDAARSDLRQARNLADQIEDHALSAELALDLAAVLDGSGDVGGAQALVEEARELAPIEPSPRLGARLALGIARAHVRRGDDKGAAPLLRNAAAQAARLGSRGYELQVAALTLLGCALARERDVARSRDTFRACVALCESRVDRLQLATVLSNRSTLWIWQNDPTRAAQDALRSYQLSRELGLLDAEYAAARSVAEIYYYTGDLDAAAPHVDRAIELEPLVYERPLIRLLAARIAVLAGDLQRAQAELHAVRTAENRARQLGRGSVLTDADEVMLSMVELVLERAPIGAWRALRRYAQQVCSFEQRIDVMDVMGYSLWREGHVEPAEEVLVAALAASSETPHIIAHRVSTHLTALHCEHTGVMHQV